MQGGEVRDKFKAVFEAFTLPLNELNEKYLIQFKQEDDKKIKKKFKKYFIDAQDSNETALQKFNKMFDQLTKNYEIASKSFAKVKQAQNVIQRNQSQYEKANQQKVVVENLYNSFRSKYDEELKKAQQIQTQEQNKRKEVIDELQGRIKTIQQKYEEAGKNKIQKYKEHQTLKHQLNKLQPHLIASQSLYDAQLKKKTIEIEIQMTTLKQKIQMMKNFKKMAGDTEEKVITAKANQEKIAKRIKTLEGKEEQHKIVLTKAHLVFQDYKKAIHKLKEILPKKQKEAFIIKDRINKGKAALTDIAKTLTNLDKQYETQVGQLQTLKNLEQNLMNQLQA